MLTADENIYVRYNRIVWACSEPGSERLLTAGWLDFDIVRQVIQTLR
jgi:hypothetical protein